MNKSLLGLNLLMLLGAIGFAQQNVGIGTLTPNPNAMLEIQSSDKGLLLPRMTTTERTAIAATANDVGLIVYDLNDSLFYFWNGTAWKYYPSQPGDNGWLVSGNNVYSSVSGNVGIGVTNPSAKLHVLGTVRLANLSATTTNLDIL